MIWRGKNCLLSSIYPVNKPGLGRVGYAFHWSTTHLDTHMLQRNLYSKNSTNCQNVGAQPEHYLLVQWPEYVGKESEKNNSEFICWSASMRKYNTTCVLRRHSSPTWQSVPTWHSSPTWQSEFSYMAICQS